MGIAGAGYATAIATYGAAIYGFVLLFKSEQKLFTKFAHLSELIFHYF